LAKELPWSAAAEDVEEAAPVGDVEGLDEARSSVGEYRGSSDVGG